MSVSIVIPFRNEELLSPTVAAARKTAGADAEIITVDDGSRVSIDARAADKCLRNDTPIGLCYSRHRGITEASNDVVILLDSHMFFIPESDWAARMEKHVRKHPSDVCMAKSVRCNEERYDPVWHEARGRVESGARFVEWQRRSCGRLEVLARKWTGDRKYGTHPVSCILGGCYALNKNFYLNELAGIWQYHAGWGFSEQLISMATHYRGGRTMYLGDIPVGHLYRTGKQSIVPYTMELWKVIHNNMLLVELFVRGEDRERYAEWLKNDRPLEVRDAVRILEKAPIAELKAHFGDHWEWWKGEHLCSQ